MPKSREEPTPDRQIKLSIDRCIDWASASKGVGPTPADIIQTDSHFELVTQRHSGGVAALLRRFLLRLGPHKQSRGPFYDKGDPPCGSFTSGGFVHCSSTHSFNLTASKGRALRRVPWSQRIGLLYL